MIEAQRARYVALFATEARSLLGSARQALVDWLVSPDEAAPGEALFRALHTLKGMAASLEFESLVGLVHQVEDELALLRSEAGPGVGSRAQGLGPSLDDIEDLVETILAGESVAPTRAAAPSRVVRVGLNRLDALSRDLGGVVTARQQLDRQLLADPFTPVARSAGLMARRLDVLQDRILEVRLAPLAEVFDRLSAPIRTLARQLGKEVQVDLDGGDIEVDRGILDQLLDPLLHLLRNAVDHGIEMPDTRRAAGKAGGGRIRVQARLDRESVVVEIRDDGAGIDREAVARRARADGTLAEDTALTDEGLLATLARPGFSTAAAVTAVSGRGVGLDAVVATLQGMGAALTLSSIAGRGTLFVIRLPTRLGIVRALVASVGPEHYVLPLMHVLELAPCEPGDLTVAAGRSVLTVHDQRYPVVDLRRLVQYRGEAAPRRRPAVILQAGDQSVAMLADAVHGQVDAVLQAIERPVGMPRWVTGATLLDDGHPALMLDLASVV